MSNFEAQPIWENTSHKALQNLANLTLLESFEGIDWNQKIVCSGQLHDKVFQIAYAACTKNNHVFYWALRGYLEIAVKDSRSETITLKQLVANIISYKKHIPDDTSSVKLDDLLASTSHDRISDLKPKEKLPEATDTTFELQMTRIGENLAKAIVSATTKIDNSTTEMVNAGRYLDQVVAIVEKEIFVGRLTSEERKLLTDWRKDCSRITSTWQEQSERMLTWTNAFSSDGVKHYFVGRVVRANNSPTGRYDTFYTELSILIDRIAHIKDFQKEGSENKIDRHVRVSKIKQGLLSNFKGAAFAGITYCTNRNQTVEPAEVNYSGVVKSGLILTCALLGAVLGFTGGNGAVYPEAKLTKAQEEMAWGGTRINISNGSSLGDPIKYEYIPPDVIIENGKVYTQGTKLTIKANGEKLKEKSGKYDALIPNAKIEHRNGGAPLGLGMIGAILGSLGGAGLTKWVGKM
jgi:hypothetical protein